MNSSRWIRAGLGALVLCAALPGVAEELERVRVARLLANSPWLRPAGSDEPFPDFDPLFEPPKDHPTFRLSQNYPAAYDLTEKFDWMDVDFTKEPERYARAVLQWCIEGTKDFDYMSYGAQNPKRPFFHAPWMHDDGRDLAVSSGSGLRTGREALRGLTKERDLRRESLGPDQKQRRQAWAVSLYNARGGYGLGRIWQTATGFPDPSQANFPSNTVTFKLLFSDATPEDAPYLANSLTWKGHIYEAKEADPDTYKPKPDDTEKSVFRKPARVVRDLRLLQIDVAVKDPRVAGNTGWVFGTYIYDGGAQGKEWWQRMVPVGLSWGDDADVKPEGARDGLYVNPKLKETWLNPELMQRTPANAGNRAFVTHVGYDGRLNGPVDNPASSCISCHGRAGAWARIWDEDQTNRGNVDLTRLFGMSRPFIPEFKRDENDKEDRKLVERFPLDEFSQWFGAVESGAQLNKAKYTDPKTRKAEEGPFMSLDYSLQVAVGMRNFYNNVRNNRDYLHRLEKAGLVTGKKSTEIRDCKLPDVSR